MTGEQRQPPPLSLFLSLVQQIVFLASALVVGVASADFSTFTGISGVPRRMWRAQNNVNALPDLRHQ